MSTPPPGVRFSATDSVSVEQFVDVLQRSGLLERRPVTRPEVAEAMLRGADVLVTAWEGELLVGVARAITDFVFCTYLSDLAVDNAYQRRGIGRELVRRAQEAGGAGGTLVALAAPAAEDYYPRLGMTRHGSCWILSGEVSPPVGRC